MDKGQEESSKLIIACGDPAELLEFEEEGFHKMAFLVEAPINEPRIVVIVFGWDAEVRIVVNDKLTQRPFAVSLICEKG
jgi:hypothetical protein